MESLDYYASQKYTTVIRHEWDQDEVYFVASHPELDGCIATGADCHEAEDNLVDARREYLKSLLDDGIVPPEPKVLSDGVHDISGWVGHEYTT